MKIKDKTWVFIADGSKALVIRNDGTPMSPSLSVVRASDRDQAATRELGRDKPGRMPDVGPNHRSSMEAPDLHEREEERFLQDELQRLAADYSNGQFRSVVVIAPPVALGRLRDALEEPLKSAVVAEVDKGLAQMPIADITKAIERLPEP